MAVRTTAAEVKQIMDDCTVSDSIVTAIITSANALVNDVFEDDSDLSSQQLEDIECWLTAHMVAAGPQRSTSTKEEKVGDAAVTYTGRFGSFLESTTYGQMVLILDTTGKMSRYIGKSGASIYAIPS